MPPIAIFLLLIAGPYVVVVLLFPSLQPLAKRVVAWSALRGGVVSRALRAPLVGLSLMPGVWGAMTVAILLLFRASWDVAAGWCGAIAFFPALATLAATSSHLARQRALGARLPFIDRDLRRLAVGATLVRSFASITLGGIAAYVFFRVASGS